MSVIIDWQGASMCPLGAERLQRGVHKKGFLVLGITYVW